MKYVIWMVVALSVSSCGKVPTTSLTQVSNLAGGGSSGGGGSCAGSQWFSGGCGTASNPYLISTVTDLSNVWRYPAASYSLLNSIVGPYPAVTLTPLGPIGWTFSGTFDGHGFTISNFYMNWVPADGGTGDDAGLFGVNTGTIQNIVLSQIIVVGHNNVGTLVGDNQGTVSNCSGTGGASGNADIGGIAGEAITGSVTGSSSTATVTGNSNTGQLVGLSL